MQATRALFRLEGMGCSVAVQYLFWVSYVLRFRNGVLVQGVSADEWETEAEAVRFGNELMRRCFERHAEPRLNSSFLGVWAFRGFGVWGVLGVREAGFPEAGVPEAVLPAFREGLQKGLRVVN